MIFAFSQHALQEAQVEISLLGPPQVSVGGRKIDLGARKQRFLLAVLAMEANRQLSIERLIDLMWHMEPPANARGMIHTYVSGLRRLLRTTGASDEGVWLDRQSSGYVLRCDPGFVDAHRFQVLVGQARGSTDDDVRLASLDQALALWRGPALAGIAADEVRVRLSRGLEETRLFAVEERVETLERLGRKDGLLDALLVLTAEHPLRPRLIGALMRELHRIGRASEALAVYRDFQQRMRDESGLDPPAMLQELQLALLRDDRALNVHTTAPTIAAPVQRQLPRDVPTFTGRTAEIAQLLEASSAGADSLPTVVINAIDGMAGIGKTALAVHIAHRLADHYPDGQLFIDLHGYTEGTGPVAATEALDRMLRALGVPGEQVPTPLDERTTFYRSRLAGQRVLILLDNAVDERQVRPLLPGAPGCLVLVTSRHRMTGLDHTFGLSLDVLPLPDAVGLLVRAAGEHRLATEPPELLAETVELCGRLPLAIRIAAARLRSHPAWSVADLVNRLRERRSLLAELEAAQRSVAAALDLSYQQLSQNVQRMYRLLGLHAGPDLNTSAVAALTGESPTKVGRSLECLIEDHLLQEPVPGRYRFHDLVGAHAAQLAFTDPDHREALNRLHDYYAHCATAAIGQLYPPEENQKPQINSNLDSPAKASAWLETELPNLLATAYRAADHGRYEYLLRLSTILSRWLRVCGRGRDAEALSRRALEVARARGYSDAEIHALSSLAGSLRMQAKYEAATDPLEQAIKIARATGNRSAELYALASLARLHRVQGRYEQATTYFRHVLTVADTLGDPAAELEARLGLGWIDRLQRRYEQAVRHMKRAQTIARVTGNRRAEVDATNGLGFLHQLQGRSGLAIDHFELAKQIAHEIGNRTAVLIATFGVGETLLQQGQCDSAADHMRQALDCARALDNRNWQFEPLHGLGRAHRAAGRPGLAINCHQEALELATELDHRADQARAHSGLGYAHHTTGQLELANHHWQRALDHLDFLGLEQTEDEETTAAAIRAKLARR